jgi:hypothetical protein
VKGLKQRRRTFEAARGSVGDRQLSALLAFFNLAAATALVVAIEMASVCIVLHPEAAAARYVPDWLASSLEVSAAAVVGISVLQLVPGPQRWRALRQRAGIANLLLGWPLVFALALAAYLQLPSGLQTCP